MKLQAKTLTDLESVSREILTKSESKIITFEGPIGVGKTTLIQALCKTLGINEKVTSPSYSVVNEYITGDAQVYHFDFYRINDEEEAYDIGIEEYFYSDNYCFIEWPEKIPNLLPEDYTRIRIGEIDKIRHYDVEVGC